jgi:invasion protein IalB
MKWTRTIAGWRWAGCAAIVCMWTITGVGQGGQTTAPATLPGGATQLQETHGDWRVTCAQQTGNKVCALSQQLSDKDSRQLVMAVELETTSADKAEGTLVLPFGLAVSRPVTLQVDEGALTPLSFRTCLPVGCIVALTFDPAILAALRKGTALTVRTVADNAQEMPFTISLKGFGSAFDRTAALSK